MNAAPYIPAKDADFQSWLLNFSTLITAAPTTYGLVSGDATIIAASYTAWHAAYLLATDPSTRTAPTVADKDAQRAAATATVRPYAQQIAGNGAVSDMDKLSVGVNPRNPSRTPIPAPTTAPALSLVSAAHLSATLAYYDTSTPASKAKPFGAVALQLYGTIGTAVSVDPDSALYIDAKTKSPTSVTWGAGDVGKIITLWGRWVTKSGPAGTAQVGPWSTSLHFSLL